MLVGHTFVISGAHCLNGLDEKVCMIFRSEKVRRNLAVSGGLAADFAVVRGCVALAAWIMNKKQFNILFVSLFGPL